MLSRAFSGWVLTMVIPLMSGCVVDSIGDGRRLALDENGDPAEVVPPPVDPDDETELPPPPPPPPPRVDPFNGAHIGVRCAKDGGQEWIIVLGPAEDCAEAARWTDVGDSTERFATFVVDQELTAGVERTFLGETCEGGVCEPFAIAVSADRIDPDGSVTASWAATDEAIRWGGTMTATACAFPSLDLGPPLVEDVVIDEISLTQAVNIPLMRDGAEVTERDAPVITNKPALVRVFASPEAGYRARAIDAELVLDDGTEQIILHARKTITAASSIADLASTFNFEIDEGLIRTGTSYRVSLRELEGCGAMTSGAQFPVDGLIELAAEPTGGPFELVIVPVQYGSDGSDRLPDLTPDQLRRYQERATAIFPAESVELTVRATALTWNSAVRSGGTGWSSLLDAIIRLRRDDGVSRNTYYFGAFSPASSFRNYCGGGCITGLGMVPGADDSFNRASIGLGFSGQTTIETFTHEVGHSLGRPHAPCGVSAPAGFPHQGARLGAWGYHLFEQELMPPNDWRDMMSYCDPQWISDYNYERIFRRVRYANQNLAQATGEAEEASRYLTAHFSIDGAIWSDPVTVTGIPGGTPISVDFIDGAGRGLGSGLAYAYPYDHLDGGWILVQPPEKARGILVEGWGRILLDSAE